MFSLVQENNHLKMKYYELLGQYNKLKDEHNIFKYNNIREIEHLQKINGFLKNKTLELNKTIVDRNQHVLHLVREKRHL
jgi:hypothetical protein